MMEERNKGKTVIYRLVLCNNASPKSILSYFFKILKFLSSELSFYTNDIYSFLYNVALHISGLKNHTRDQRENMLINQSNIRNDC